MVKQNKKILIVDGQGGRIGRMLVEQIKMKTPALLLIAIGTNSIATSTMLKAGAEQGATGENPVLYNAADADLIVGPVGILVANSLLGEITPAMARAIAASPALKILIPVNRCNIMVVGVQEKSLAEFIRLAVEQVFAFLNGTLSE